MIDKCCSRNTTEADKRSWPRYCAFGFQKWQTGIATEIVRVYVRRQMYIQTCKCNIYSTDVNSNVVMCYHVQHFTKNNVWTSYKLNIE